MLWRHGDVLIAATPAIPEDAKRRPTRVLVYGEQTGHSHRIAEADTATLYELGDTLYLRVHAPHATVVHEEHRPIVLPQGSYRVWTQREYTPQAVRPVVD